MTKDETSALLHAVKRSHWDPEIGMRLFLKMHPHLEPTPEMYGLAICVGRTPFPNIKGLPEGPFPVDKQRPWWDARMWQDDDQTQWEAEMKEL